MSVFKMPSLGADMEAGKLVEWLVKPGAPVKRGDIIAVVETQKGAIEIEVFEDGFFERPLVELGAKLAVGTPIAEIAATAAAIAPPVGKPEVAPTPPAASPAPIAPARPGPPLPPSAKSLPLQQPQRARATPAARHRAEEAGVDLHRLTPTGPSGAIVLADVEAEIASAAAPVQEVSAVPSGMRAAIAAAMGRSKREIPHYYLAHVVDLGATEAFVGHHNANRSPADRLLIGALFVKAVSLAARKHSSFNGHFVDGEFRPSPAVHAGVAINIRGTGLVAPAIHDTDQCSLDELMAAMRDLVIRVRAGRFRGSELSDPTITVSSLGERGVESLYGVIYPPQVAIVGFGTPVERAWASGGMIGVRRTVSLTLAGDHRVSDGHRGALFLAAIADLLSEPENL